MSTKNIYTTANLTDTELKEQGNRLFSSRKFDDAIQCYTKAIVGIKPIIHRVSCPGIDKNNCHRVTHSLRIQLNVPPPLCRSRTRRTPRTLRTGRCAT